MGLGFVGWWGWGHRKVTRACPLTQTQVHGWSREMDGPCHGPFIPLLFCPQYLLRPVSARPGAEMWGGKDLSPGLTASGRTQPGSH